MQTYYVSQSCMMEKGGVSVRNLGFTKLECQLFFFFLKLSWRAEIFLVACSYPNYLQDEF